MCRLAGLGGPWRPKTLTQTTTGLPYAVHCFVKCVFPAVSKKNAPRDINPPCICLRGAGWWCQAAIEAWVGLLLVATVVRLPAELQHARAGAARDCHGIVSNFAEGAGDQATARGGLGVSAESGWGISGADVGSAGWW